MRDFYGRLFDYDTWATGRVITALAASTAVPARAVELLAHILIAKRLWMARIRGEDTTRHPIWPALSLAECQRLAPQVSEEFARFLDEGADGWDQHTVCYRNTKGQQFENRIADILLHIAHHAAYHRGQIAGQMRAAGLEPVNTDYITYARGL